MRVGVLDLLMMNWYLPCLRSSWSAHTRWGLFWFRMGRPDCCLKANVGRHPCLLVSPVTPTSRTGRMQGRWELLGRNDARYTKSCQTLGIRPCHAEKHQTLLLGIVALQGHGCRAFRLVECGGPAARQPVWMHAALTPDQSPAAGITLTLRAPGGVRFKPEPRL